MADQLAVAEPIVQPQQVQQPVVPVVAVPEPDLITKVTNFKRNQTPEIKITDDVQDFSDIKDPIAREIALKRYRALQSDYTRKTKEIAEERKSFDAKLVEMKNWSPERIQNELLTDPQFLQAAQKIAGNINQNPTNSGLTDEQYSALTDKEKSELLSLKNEINSLKQVNLQAILSQTDVQLRTKYTDYDPIVVDNSLRELMNMQPHQLREYVYKAKMHDIHVQNAYEMARQEVSQLNQTRNNAISVDGNNITNNDGLPVRQPGQNDRTWFETLANFRLAQSRKK